MSGLNRETRLQIMLSDQELAAVDDWRFQHRMPSRAATVRQLLNIGLKARGNGAANAAMRSQDYGLLGENGSETD